MRKITAALIFLFIFVFAVSGHSDQWKLFEHRYSYKLEDVLQASKFVQKKGYWEDTKTTSLSDMSLYQRTGPQIGRLFRETS